MELIIKDSVSGILHLICLGRLQGRSRVGLKAWYGLLHLKKIGESFTLQKYHEPGPGGGNGLPEKG